MRRLLLAGILSLGWVFAQTQVQMNETARAEYQRADAELNKTYNEVLQQHRTDAVFLSKLRRAQRAWLTFREAEVEAVFPAANPSHEYGSIYPVCRFRLLKTLSEERLSQLKLWKSGMDETETCAGSRRASRSNGLGCGTAPVPSTAE